MRADQARVEALARVAVENAFPEDLALFPVTAKAYFADPSRAVKAARAPAKDEMLGFGVEMAEWRRWSRPRRCGWPTKC